MARPAFGAWAIRTAKLAPWPRADARAAAATTAQYRSHNARNRGECRGDLLAHGLARHFHRSAAVTSTGPVVARYFVQDRQGNETDDGQDRHDAWQLLG